MFLFFVPRSLPNLGGEQQSSSQCVEHGEGHLRAVEERLQDSELAGESEEGSCAASGGNASQDGEAQCAVGRELGKSGRGTSGEKSSSEEDGGSRSSPEGRAEQAHQGERRRWEG